MSTYILKSASTSATVMTPRDSIRGTFWRSDRRCPKLVGVDSKRKTVKMSLKRVMNGLTRPKEVVASDASGIVFLFLWVYARTSRSAKPHVSEEAERCSSGGYNGSLFFGDLPRGPIWRARAIAIETRAGIFTVAHCCLVRQFITVHIEMFDGNDDLFIHFVIMCGIITVILVFVFLFIASKKVPWHVGTGHVNVNAKYIQGLFRFSNPFFHCLMIEIWSFSAVWFVANVRWGRYW